jgi:HEAT repeat protein
MKQLLTVLIASVAAAFSQAAPHGGTYRGPSDSTAPGGGSGGSSSGATGGTSTPSTGGATAPGSPASGGSNTGGSTVTGTTTTSSSSAPTIGPDVTRWQTWWGFNKDSYLDVKARVHFSDVLAGSDESFLGGKRLPLTRDDLRPSPESVRKVIVPALLEALRKESSNDILSGALIALAKIGDAPGEAQIGHALAPFLADANQELAETAAVSLGILGNEADIALLRALLFGDVESVKANGVPQLSAISERTRAFAAYGLGLVGARAGDSARARIVDALIAWMQRNEAAQRQSEIPVGCTIALGLVGLPLDPLAAQLPEDEPVVRPALVLSREQQLAWMLATLNNREQPNVLRAHATTSIARLLRGVPSGHWLRERAVRELSARLTKRVDENTTVRLSCVLALGAIGDCDGDALDVRIRTTLSEVRDELRDPLLGQFALVALAQSGGRAGAGVEPFAALGQKNSPRSVLLEQLGKGSSATRCWAALALGVLEHSLSVAQQPVSSDVTAALRAALADARAPDEVGAFAIATGIAADPGAQALLRVKLDETADHDARGYVAVALGLLGDAASITHIEEIVAGSRFQPELLRQAALALGLLGDKNVVPQLVTMLSGASSLSSQAAIASALGLIGDARSIDPLIAMLADKATKSDLARAFAAVALGICADKEDLPWNAKVSSGVNYRANTATLYSPDTGTGILDIL